MRLRRASTAIVAVLLVSCATSAPLAQRAPMSDLLGVRLGMTRGDVRSTLAATAKFEREERRRQEIWTIANDPRFASLIIGYTPEWNVRFVTAIAKPGGVAVRYEDVLDTSTAGHRAAGNTHTWTWSTGTPKYYVIAIGAADRLEYLSIKAQTDFELERAATRHQLCELRPRVQQERDRDCEHDRAGCGCSVRGAANGAPHAEGETTRGEERAECDGHSRRDDAMSREQHASFGQDPDRVRHPRQSDDHHHRERDSSPGRQ
jgi:hypothetical protein